MAFLFLPIRPSAVYLKAKASLPPSDVPAAPIKNHGFKVVRSGVTYDLLDPAKESVTRDYSIYRPQRLFPELVAVPEPPSALELSLANQAAGNFPNARVSGGKDPNLFDIDIQVNLVITKPPDSSSSLHSSDLSQRQTSQTAPGTAQLPQQFSDSTPAPRSTAATAPTAIERPSQPTSQPTPETTAKEISDKNERELLVAVKTTSPVRVTKGAVSAPAVMDAAKQVAKRGGQQPASLVAGLIGDLRKIGLPDINKIAKMQEHISLAERKKQKKPLMHSMDVRKLPITKMRRFREELRGHRDRPFARTAVKRDQEKRRAVPIEAMVSGGYRDNVAREAMLSSSLVKSDNAAARAKRAKAFKRNFEETLPAVRDRRARAGPKVSSLAAVVDNKRVAQLMDVAQFYRGSKRLIGEKTSTVNKETKPQRWEYSNALSSALDCFAADWEEANFVERRAKLLNDAWPTKWGLLRCKLCTVFVIGVICDRTR